jgi:hypothetical protein
MNFMKHETTHELREKYAKKRSLKTLSSAKAIFIVSDHPELESPRKERRETERARETELVRDRSESEIVRKEEGK